MTDPGAIHFALRQKVRDLRGIRATLRALDQNTAAPIKAGELLDIVNTLEVAVGTLAMVAEMMALNSESKPS